MLKTPQLLDDILTFRPSDYVTDGICQRLAEWDRSPAMAPDALNRPAHPRLGLYFETLYECLLRDLLGWQVLVRNLPVRGAQRTLGELDCVVRNPHTGGLEHHEISVKFYLGYPGEGGACWYGPNARDRLDLKTRHLLDHQSQLTGLPETQAALQAAGISGPLVPRIFMPGYLFYPQISDTAPPPQAPMLVPDNHARGHWCRLGEVSARAPANWVPLNKPHWLGPWWQESRPDPELAGAAMELVGSRASPRLFASLEQNAATGVWRETERWFVVPEAWPGIH